jgi:ribosomal protein S18 acetylase RimI-like enzyme
MQLTRWIQSLFRLPSLEEINAVAKVKDNTIVRPITWGDIDDVLAISKVADHHPLNRDDVCAYGWGCLGTRTVVAEWYGGVHGFCVWQEETEGVDVIRLTVEPDAPVLTLAGHMLDHVIRQLGSRRHVYIVCDGSNTEANDFYRKCGFKALTYTKAMDLFTFRYTRKD